MARESEDTNTMSMGKSAVTGVSARACRSPSGVSLTARTSISTVARAQWGRTPHLESYHSQLLYSSTVPRSRTARL
jgi:hypothetical protein